MVSGITQMTFLMKHFLCCIIAAANISGYAQTTDKVLARVTYNFSHLRDTTKRDQVHTEAMRLIIGKNASLYTSAFNVAQADEIRQMMTKSAGQQGAFMSVGSNLRSTLPATARGSFESITMPTLTDYYFFSKTRKFYTKEQLDRSYLVEEDAPEIKWKTTSDTSSFFGIVCRKATTYFKGRNWTAWYSEELPFQSGPWKLNGLPGLIIEAYDDSNEVQFRFAGIEKENSANSSSPDKTKSGTAGMPPEMQNYINDMSSYLGDEIRLPENIIRTSVSGINKLKKAMEKDPEGFFKSQMGAAPIVYGRTAMSTVSLTAGFTIGTQENNPIEKSGK